jgi:hypothetical protein
MSTDLIARLWILDLRRECFIEIGGTSSPTDIWRRVRHHIDTNEITAQGDRVKLSRREATQVRRLAKELAEHVAVDRSGAIW